MSDTCAADPRSFIDRLWTRLGFGECANPDPWPEEMEGFAESHLCINTISHFDFWDRLKILISGKVMVAASTKTDVTVHQAISASSVSVLPPNWRAPGNPDYEGISP